MKLTSEALNELYQQQTARSTRGQAECLTEETLLRAATGELSRSERQCVADHLMVCSDCAEEYRLIRSLKPWAEQVAAASGEPAPEAKAAGKPLRWAAWVQTLWEQLVWLPKWRAAAVIAMIVVAVGATLTLWRARQPGVEPVPSERGEVSVTMTVEPPNRAVLREPPERLAWSAVESAESYQVVLYDFESTPIWESPPVTRTAVQLPEAVRQGLPRGQPTYWRVIVVSGIERRQSELFQFVLTTNGHR